MTAPESVHQLIERFRLHRDAYKSSSYNEAQVRREFIDPMFKALGWDVDNEKGYAEPWKEVVHEDSIKVGQGTKAPDYSFRLGGRRLFFLEAKKPAVNLKDDPSPAYQLRRYAWTAKMPLSILTDFEEFIVYDTRVQPAATDKASKARVCYMTYEEYPERWEEIDSIFSPDAIRKGAFDKYVESTARKRGTAEVDDAFLAEIEQWRELLARNLALRNPRLSQRELNFAVQRTIDRIIFLRICEDRGVEEYGRLRALLDGAGTYSRLLGLFAQADDRYNSGLFYFRPEKGRPGAPDALTPQLEIDDKVLKTIFKRLYYPDSPYEFSVFPPEILGHVYERFLGSVIRLTKGHQAKVEQKPEVRKAGGVYYTPTYIVDYIVKHTVGKLIGDSGLGVGDSAPGPKALTPKEVSKLRVLDPACGSGSFLLGAYQYLLDWHLEWYIAHEPERWARGKKAPIYPSLPRVASPRSPAPGWRLTTAERKRILLNNIYGVDIDPQAVEVTKLSLLLKVLEEENAETLERQLTLFRERALPDLAGNIKCGNSLIGPDFYEGRQRGLFDEEELYRVNAFDWNAEFPEIMKAGGFDAVIGNPPWGADIPDNHKGYFRQSYKLGAGKFESYIFFIERAGKLLHRNGYFGFITPSYWISRSQTEPVRSHLLGNLWPSALIVLPDSVFEGVKMDACIVVCTTTRKGMVNVAEITAKEIKGSLDAEYLEQQTHPVKVDDWLEFPATRFNPRINASNIGILKKYCQQGIPLETMVEISQGLTLYRRSTLAERFGKKRAEEIVSNRSFHSDHKKDNTYKKELLGRDVARYQVRWNGKSWVSYGPWLAHAVDERFFQGPRLVIQKLRNPMLSQRLVVGYLDDDETYSAGVLLNVITRSQTPYGLYYIMGILNAKSTNYFYRARFLDVSIRVIDLKELPIRRIDFKEAEDVARHNRIISLVQRMLDLHKRLQEASTDHEKTLLQRQITATDREIDQLVYELYDLTPEEIAIVEGA